VKITRTDQWKLKTNDAQRRMLRETVRLYRDYTRLLIGVVWTHWPYINSAESQCHAVERLIHATADNPSPRYRLFDRRFHKFPSYLRRAAIEAACGQVSSFITRYGQWQSGQRKRRDALPPRRTNDNARNPALYRGQCIKFDEAYAAAEIKVWNGNDWVWITVPLASKRLRHAVPTNKALSPALLTDSKTMRLSVPFESTVSIPVSKKIRRACAVDLGINSTATASIVTQDGTVVARKFFHRAADIDRRDKGLLQIRRKAGQTTGATGKLGRGFCRGLYRKAANRNRDKANRLSGEIVSFALEHEAEALVFEHLKHFRPAAGKKRSTLRQRFHGWLHRKLFDKTRERAQEACIRVACVNPRGTSKYAYDGSGLVTRDPKNTALATFSTGKHYNADLNASYNIAARWFAGVLGLSGRKTKACASGKSSRTQPRIPVSLLTLWLHAQPRLGGEVGSRDYSASGS